MYYNTVRLRQGRSRETPCCRQDGVYKFLRSPQETALVQVNAHQERQRAEGRGF